MKNQEITPAELYVIADRYAAGESLRALTSELETSIAGLERLLESKLPPGLFGSLIRRRKEAIVSARFQELWTSTKENN